MKDHVVVVGKNVFKKIDVRDLPHGWGIDGDWRGIMLKNGNVRFYNSWHYMNDNGCYDGWFPFSVTFRPDFSFYIQFHRLMDYEYRIISDIRLKDYLYDVFDFYVESLRVK